jgi:hypothetical protein
VNRRICATFLFGSERAALAAVRPVLLDVQHGRCFYCQAALRPAATHVDHFVAWARYPVDLGHNFVLADSRCNNQKRDRLPACDHLAAWVERNAEFGAQITDELERRGIIAELVSSKPCHPVGLFPDGRSRRVDVVAGR